MNIWKFLLITAPIWGVIECSLMLPFKEPKTTKPLVPSEVEFRDQDALCQYGEDFCAAIGSSLDHQGNKDIKPWQLPKALANQPELNNGVYFSLQGEYLGTDTPEIDYSANEVALNEVLLKDARNWFETTVESPIENWIVKKNDDGYFEQHIGYHYLVRNNELTGWLKGWGGWFAEPRSDLNVEFLDGTHCRVGVYEEGQFLHVVNYMLDRKLEFDLENGRPEFLECSDAGIIVAINDIEKNIPISDWELNSEKSPTSSRSKWNVKLKQSTTAGGEYVYESTDGEILNIELPSNMTFVAGNQFGDGLAPVLVEIDNSANRMHGYIDESGKIAIYPKFKEAASFSNGIAVIIYCKYYNQCEKGIIDKQGEWFIEPGTTNFEFERAYVRAHNRIEFFQ